jgi:hypothetical protein
VFQGVVDNDDIGFGRYTFAIVELSSSLTIRTYKISIFCSFECVINNLENRAGCQFLVALFIDKNLGEKPVASQRCRCSRPVFSCSFVFNAFWPF